MCQDFYIYKQVWCCLDSVISELFDLHLTNSDWKWIESEIFEFSKKNGIDKKTARSNKKEIEEKVLSEKRPGFFKRLFV